MSLGVPDGSNSTICGIEMWMMSMEHAVLKMVKVTADLFSPYSCFISDPAVFFATFLTPICVIIVFNSVILVLITRALIVHILFGRKIGTKLSIRRVIIIILYMMILFGLPWLFGALTVKEASTTFQYLFSIFSGFQGFFISLHQCVTVCVNNKNGRQFLCLCRRSISKLILHLLVL